MQTHYPNFNKIKEDTDGDGVKDTDDEYPDDSSKATVMSATGSGKISIFLHTETNPGLFLSDATAISDSHEALNPEGKPAYGDFKDGMIVLKVNGLNPGEEVKITLIFPSESSLQKKFFMTDGQEFYEEETAQITDSTVIFTITDGGDSDADHTENGEILVAGGLAFFMENSGMEDRGGGSSCFGSGTSHTDFFNI